jgi:hypothetical protein
VFVAQLTRDLAAREAVGAGLMMPGAKHWPDAFDSLGKVLSVSKSPVKAGKVFKSCVERMKRAQKEGACFVNAHMCRSRSGGFELLTWEVAKHPLTKAGYEGIIVRSYLCMLQRGGSIYHGRSKLAFCSWHALARMRERSKIDLFDSRGVVAGCGLAGLLLRRSDRHANSGLYYATAETLLCAGVLRSVDSERGTFGFYDVLTAFQPDEEGPQVAQWRQGVAVAQAVHKYIDSNDANPAGYVDDVDVMPFHYDDYVSRELKKAG